MNLGFFGFPNRFNNNIVDIKEFNSSGVYYVPKESTYVLAFVIAAGGGGGGGGRYGTSTNSFGGGGGGAGAKFFGTLPTLPDTDYEPVAINVSLGSGGAGGAAALGDGFSGGAGSQGGNSTLAFINSDEITPFLNLIGGGGGSGGTNANGNPGVTRTAYVNGFLFSNLAAGAGSTTSATNLNVTGPHVCGGAGGAGVSATNITAAGNSIFFPSIDGVNTSCVSDSSTALGAAVLAGGGTNGGVAAQSSYKQICGLLSPGYGGAGGGGGLTAAASRGGDGYRGSGGGGGGGSRSGFASGVGGRGGDGYAVFVAMR